MTATIDPAIGGPGMTELVSRAESLLRHRRGVAQWWVELVAILDALGARVTHLRPDSVEMHSLAEQIRLDAPHLYSNLRRLEEESEQLQQEILQVRITAGQSVGDDSRIAELTEEILTMLRRLRRLELRSNGVMLDAYDRDIGGE